MRCIQAAVIVLLLCAHGSAGQPAAGSPATAPPPSGGGTIAAAPTLSLAVGLLAKENWPFSRQTDAGQMEGFEVELMNALCKAANLACNPVPLQSLEERLDGVANGAIDMTISSLSFTPARAAVVRFVRPFYYSSGVALFADPTRGNPASIFGPGGKPGAPTATTGWRGAFTGNFPVGQTLCFIEGYYAVPFVLADFGSDVNIDLSPTLEDAVAKVRSGDCAALAYDSVTPESVVGLTMLNAPQVYVAPYGVALNQQAAGTELEARLSWALTGLMSNGNDSAILQLEQQFLVPFGVGPSSSLHSMVDAVTFFGPSEATGPGKIPASYTLFGQSPGQGRRRLFGRRAGGEEWS